jgi:hypothetical protein
VWEASDHEAGKIPENSPKKPKAQRHKPKHSPVEVVLVLFIARGVVKLSAKSLLFLLKVTLPVGPLVVVLPDSTVHPVLHNGCLLQPS